MQKKHNIKHNIMLRYFSYTTLFFVVFTLLPNYVVAQNYIHHATYLGGSSFELPVAIKAVNGAVHTIGYGSSSNYPVTNSSTNGGSDDIVYTKLDANTGNVLYSTYLGGSNSETKNTIMAIAGDITHIVFQTTSTNVAVTNGSTNAGSVDMVYVRINHVTGQIEFATYLGGSAIDIPTDIKVANGKVHIIGYTSSTNFPVSAGSAYGGGQEGIYAQLDAVTGTRLYSRYLSGSQNETTTSLAVTGNEVHILGSSNSSNYPVTNGSTLAGNSDATYTKLDATTGAIGLALYLGGSQDEYPRHIRVVGGVAHILGQTFSNNYPITNSQTATGAFLYVAAYSQINTTTGALLHSTYLGTSGFCDIDAMEIESGFVHLSGYLATINYPITTGVTLTYDDLVYTKLDAATGSVVFSTSIGTSGTGYNTAQMAVYNGEAHLAAYTYDPLFRVTNSSTTAWGDLVYVKIGSTGSIHYSTFINGTNENPVFIAASAEGAHILSYTGASDCAVTNGSSLRGGSDMLYTQYRACPSSFNTDTNISPVSQSVCVSGVADQISAAKIVATNLPIIYRNGVAGLQDEIEAMYQWQEAATPTGTWTDITDATLKNYTPQPATVSKYYRRIARNQTICGGAIVNTSQVAAVLINGNNTPVANAGGIFNTCNGTALSIGNTVIATGGAAPYTVLWDNGLGSVNQPSVNPSIPTVYTLKIVDANGCIDYDQAIVNPYTADAGPDMGNCAGSGVRIGTAIEGVAGVSYAWSASPSDPAMSCTNCAQPFVNPTLSTTYTVTVTIPVTGGGTCTRTDAVIITPVNRPVTPNFAGSDVVICRGETAPLGTAPETGFTYVWAPGNYLTSNSTATTTFQPGSLTMPIPNPSLYFLTAQKGGCSFVDEVETAVIEARAGVDGCGPRYVGELDRTPYINETYSWAKISGPGNFSGVTNLPQVPVTASVGGATTYELTVSYTLNGISHSCTDQVVVPDCGCMVDIDVNAPFGCPSFGLNGGNVQLIARAADIFSDDPSLFTYTWSPAAGLSGTTGRTVSLTDNVSRTYTVTMHSPFDPSFNCTRSILVNHPAWSLPTFVAQDPNICIGQSAAIGQATVAGYSYFWSGSNTLSSNTVSNPTANPLTTTNYMVKVTDVGSGCATTDIATVTVASPVANAGPDILMCNGAPVTLGTAAQTNTTYQWSPSGGITYLNGTSSTSAQPEFVVATTSTYTVVATNTLTGCTRSDAVTITVGTPVAPFTLPNLTYCPSAGAVTLNAGGLTGGGTTFSWSPASQVTSSNSATSTTLTPPPSSGRTYTLSVINASGCAYTTTQTITPTVTAPIVATNPILCYSSNPLYNESAQIGGAGVGGATYSWSPTTGLDNASIANPRFTPTSANGSTTFTVTKTESGCVSTAQVTVTVRGLTLPTIANPTVCQNASVQIGTTPVYGVTYSWVPFTGLNNPHIANPLATVTTSNQTYTLTAIGADGCVATQIVTVGVNPSPSPQINISNLNACLGDNNVFFNPIITPPTSYNYRWSPNDGTLSDIYAENPEVFIVATGTKTYTLEVTNAATGCQSEKTIDLTTIICPLPPTIGTIGNYVWNDLNNNGLNDEPIASGINGVAVELWKETSTGSGIYTLVQTTTTADNAGNSGYYNFVITESANYKVKFPISNNGRVLTTQNTTDATDNNSDANTIDGFSPIIAMNINGTSTAKNNPTIDAGYRCATSVTISGAATPCVAANTTLTANGVGTGITYIWDDNSTSPSRVVTPTFPTIYTVTATETSGCTASASITLNPPPVIIAVSAVATLCQGQSTDLTAGNGVSYVWSTGETANPIHVTPPVGANIYTVTSTAANGCTGTATVTVTVYGTINVASVVTVNETFCGKNNGSITITATGGIGQTLEYRLKKGATFIGWQASNVFTGLPAGNYLVQLRYVGEYCSYNYGVETITCTPPASIGDLIWYDENRDGLQDEPATNGLPNIWVKLYADSAPTVPIDSVQTDATGHYLFPFLAAGDYFVSFAPITGYQRSRTNTDNQADPITGWTAKISLTTGEAKRNVDAGYIIVTLPVQLIYFVGAADNCEVNLRWQTASEENNKEFRVERSIDNQNWLELGTVPGAGTSNSPRLYSFKDVKPMRENSYRLVQIDFDGRATTYTAANRIETNGCFDDTENGVTLLYPNPNTTDAASLKFYNDHEKQTVSLILTDVLGRIITVYSREIEHGANVVNIDITNLPEGHYYLKVNGADWHADAQKFIRIVK